MTLINNHCSRLFPFQFPDVLCITPPPSFRRPMQRPRHGPARVPEWVLRELEKPTCSSESQRANDIITRHEERRHAARRMLLVRPSSIPSTPSPRHTIRSRIQDEFDYSSDFTEEDDEDAPWVRSISRRVITNETSSGDEMLTSPDYEEDEEIKLLMTKKGRRVARRTTPTVADLGKQSSGDGSRAAGKNRKTFDSAVQNQPADGRNVIPHDRLLDPWKLPPIANLTKKGPVNLVRTTATHSETTNDGMPTISASEELLLKSIRAKNRYLKKLERRQKRKRNTANK